MQAGRVCTIREHFSLYYPGSVGQFYPFCEATNSLCSCLPCVCEAEQWMEGTIKADRSSGLTLLQILSGPRTQVEIDARVRARHSALPYKKVTGWVRAAILQTSASWSCYRARQIRAVWLCSLLRRVISALKTY